MLRHLRKTLWRPWRRRLCAGVTLLAYLAATAGVPLPAAAPPKDAEPFPCQDHPCGCRTARQCWTHCCCFTPEQRWAWAREHNVQPPAYAERPRGNGWQTVRLRDRAGPGQSSSCCACCARDGAAKPQAAPTASKKCPHCPPSPAPRCRTNEARPAVQTASASAPSRGKGKARHLLGLSALTCQGHATLWIGTGVVVPSAPPAVGSPTGPPAGWLRPSDAFANVLSFSPPEPPPRPSSWS